MLSGNIKSLNLKEAKHNEFVKALNKRKRRFHVVFLVKTSSTASKYYIQTSLKALLFHTVNCRSSFLVYLKKCMYKMLYSVH